MPDEEERRRRARDRGRKHDERGRQFHRGMAQLRGETRENGWRHEQVIKTELSERRHDTARINERGGRDFTEYNYGNRVSGPRKMAQADKDRNVLERDPHATGTWVMVHGSADRQMREKLGTMVRDFDGRFRIVEITRAEAKRARDLGRVLEERSRGLQRDLHDVAELLRVQRQRERAQRIRARARTQEAVRRYTAAREKQERTRIQARERYERQLTRLPRDVADLLGKSFPAPGERTENRPESQAAPRTKEAVERAERDRRAREAHDARLRGRLPPDVLDLLAKGRLQPGEESPFNEPPSPRSAFDSREGRERDRSRERDRGR